MKKAHSQKPGSLEKKEVDFNGQVVMVAALTAAVVSVLLLALWFYTFGFAPLATML